MNGTSIEIPIAVAVNMEMEGHNNFMFCCSCGEEVQGGDGEELPLHGSPLFDLIVAASLHRCT